MPTIFQTTVFNCNLQ